MSMERVIKNLPSRAIITSVSNKYFPSLINLLGSIKVNYPHHPKIFVYDLGLFSIFKQELKKIENVELINMPAFCPFWRSCYTWKTYIFSHPPAELNFYLDAGCQVLQPLDIIFQTLENEELFIIGQGVKFKDIVPDEYRPLFGLSDEYDESEAVHAGELGFKNSDLPNSMLQKVYNCALAGLALGFSPTDAWRNKGKDKNIFVRNCKIFRHDLTLLNIVFRMHFRNKLKIHSVEQFAGGHQAHPNQFIWHLRLNFTKLEFLHPRLLHQKSLWQSSLNRSIIKGMILAKNFKALLRKLRVCCRMGF